MTLFRQLHGLSKRISPHLRRLKATEAPAKDNVKPHTMEEINSYVERELKKVQGLTEARLKVYIQA